MRQKLYIAGPMSGLELHNYYEFKRAEIKLLGMGFEVINPHKIGLKHMLVKNGVIEEVLPVTSVLLDEYYNPGIMNELAKYGTWEFFMNLDIHHLLKCELVAVLNGWETSRGAILELTIAHFLKKKILREIDMQQLGYSFNIQKVPVDYVI